MGENMTA